MQMAADRRFRWKALFLENANYSSPCRPHAADETELIRTLDFRRERSILNEVITALGSHYGAKAMFSPQFRTRSLPQWLNSGIIVAVLIASFSLAGATTSQAADSDDEIVAEINRLIRKGWEDNKGT